MYKTIGWLLIVNAFLLTNCTKVRKDTMKLNGSLYKEFDLFNFKGNYKLNSNALAPPFVEYIDIGDSIILNVYFPETSTPSTRTFKKNQKYYFEERKLKQETGSFYTTKIFFFKNYILEYSLDSKKIIYHISKLTPNQVIDVSFNRIVDDIPISPELDFDSLLKDSRNSFTVKEYEIYDNFYLIHQTHTAPNYPAEKKTEKENYYLKDKFSFFWDVYLWH